MTTATCDVLAEHLNQLLGVPQHPDYPHALNGLQIANRSPVHRIGASVDLSLRVIEAARAAGANFLIVHHGMFWGGLQPIVGKEYVRVRALMDADIAVYSVHLPLDSHAELGNAVLLARRLGLQPNGGFAKHDDVYVGVRGECDVATAELVQRVTTFSAEHDTTVRTTPIRAGQHTLRWAICTGAGASTSTLHDAASEHIDTLLVGEGPHHTAVDAEERSITVIYAGHYATETLGVQAVAQRVSAEYDIPWIFLAAPTGL
ncbi:MAG: Nif3-like dinuclear metal center hexameric protein [Gemmatimonadaceae bacterium]